MPAKSSATTAAWRREHSQSAGRHSHPDSAARPPPGSRPRHKTERLATALHELRQGIPQFDEKQTVGQYLRTWCETTKPQIRQSTYRRYGDYVRNHLIPGLGKHPIARLRAQHLQLFYTRKIDEGLSSTTVHHMHGVLHRALEDAMQIGLVQHNVADMVRAPRKSMREMRTLSPAEVRRFLDAVRGDRFEALYILALSTGMREGELLGLRWQDIDFARRTLRVRMNVQETLGRYILAETKTTYSRRSIGLISSAIAALQRHWERQHDIREETGDMYNLSLYLVFPYGYGTIMIPHNITKRSFKCYLEKAGLPRCNRFHDLRHTSATLLLASGVNVKVVSEMLGHADVSITLRVYAHVLPHMQQTAMTAMEGLMGDLSQPLIDESWPQIMVKTVVNPGKKKPQD